MWARKGPVVYLNKYCQSWVEDLQRKLLTIKLAIYVTECHHTDVPMSQMEFAAWEASTVDMGKDRGI